MQTINQLIGNGATAIISYGDWSACIDSHGAHALGLFFEQKNLLYYDPDDIGHSGIPICLPNFGPLQNGRFSSQHGIFAIRQHGFIRDSLFQERSKSVDSVTYELSSSPQSKEKFPFDFCLTVTFTLCAQGLVSNYDLVNLSQDVLPLAPGIHPYFSVPVGDKIILETNAQYANDNNQNYAIVALEDSLETLSVSRSGVRQYIVRGCPDLHLLGHTMEKTRLMIGDHRALIIATEMSSFNRMTLWRKSLESGYICLEPAYIKNGLNAQPLLIAPGTSWNSAVRIGY